MIIDNYIAEQFIDPTTAPWTPLTGITATITIWSVVNWVKTKIIDDASCTNDWEGYYSYLFTDMQPSTFYMYEIVPSATAYRVSGWIDYRMEKIDANISDMRVWWGWGGNYSQAIQSSINNAKREIIEKIEEIPQVSLEKTEEKLSEIASQNDIYKNEIIDTIKSSENEVCSDIVRKSKELKEDNVTTRNLVRQKSEKVVKYAEKQLDRQEKTDKMIEDEANEIEKDLEKIFTQEADMIEKDLEDQYKMEADDIEKEINS